MSHKLWITTLSIVVNLAPHTSAQNTPPNLVLIMADDLGYHDLGVYGHPSIKTPILDQMAEDGIRLSSFYSGGTVCTPSRIALLTGAYPARLGWTKGVLGYKIKNHMGLSPKALTIAEIYKSAGYNTAISGKWHVGDKPKFLPQRQGFDLTYIIKRSNNQTKELWRGEELAEKPFDNRLLTQQFTDAAVEFIKTQKDKPFFLYVPYTAPHFPVQAHPEWKGKSEFGVYGDVVEELDHRIGQILATLEEEGLDKKTIVVFLSDNGPQPRQAAQAKPYRGMKWDSLEGGTRVPCIVRWPGVIPAGQKSDALIAAIDLLPTLAHACGIDLKAATAGSHPVDGLNVWSTLLGSKDVAHPRKDLLYWHGMNGFHAIRVGDWKLFLDRSGAKLEGKGENRSDGPILFHLSEDVAELTDVAKKHPERLKAMQELAQKRLAEISKTIIPLAH